MVEFKNGGLVKDMDFKNRVVTGYLSNFGNKDYDGDIIQKGAFTRTLNARKSQIFFLNQHNWKEPHGKFAVLSEDEKGLYFESNPLPDTTFSNDALKLYEAGIVEQHSIGFEIIKSDGKYGDRTITEIKLWEGSNVTLGANPLTPFTGLKSKADQIDYYKQRKKTLIKAIRNGDFTDDTFLLLEFELECLIKQAQTIGNTALADSSQGTPNNDTLAVLKEFNKQYL